MQVSASDERQLITLPFQVPGRFSTAKQISVIVKCISNRRQVFKRSTLVKVGLLKDNLLIQTDKPIYKPGGKIQFRLVNIDRNLKPKNERIDQVYIMNPTGSRMTQWTNVTLDTGISSFEMELSTKPVLGTWKIVAQSKKIKSEVNIKVEKYVLPKFEVKITSPPYILVTDKTIPIKICAKYTYGKKVVGTLKASICLNDGFMRFRKDIRPSPINKKKCIQVVKQVTGCETINFKADGKNFLKGSSLNIHAKITEKGSGIALSSDHKSKRITSQAYHLKVEVSKEFKPGLPLKIKILVNSPDGRRKMGLRTIRLRISSTRNGLSVEFDKHLNISDGVRKIEFVPRRDATFYRVMVEGVQAKTILRKYDIPKAKAETYAWVSRSSSFLDINGPLFVKAGHQAHFDISFTKEGEKELNHVVVCCGVTQYSSIQRVNGLQSSFQFTVKESMTPKCRILVFYMNGNEFVGDSHVFDVSTAASSKIAMSFSDAVSRPGDDVELTLKAWPGSKFAVSAVDQSIRLMAAETNDIEESQMTSILSQRDVSPKKGTNQGNNCFSFRGRGGGGYKATGKYDGSYALNQAGLKYLTNARVTMVLCLKPIRYYYNWNRRVNDNRRFRFRQNGGLVPMRKEQRQNELKDQIFTDAVRRPSVEEEEEDEEEEEEEKEKEKEEAQMKVRTKFPETWLWLEENIGSNGTKKLHLKIPDTITSWHVNGFAMSPTDGIGVARPTSVRGFQPFFVSLALPYSVKRGEILKIPATVFNYVDECLIIGVTLEASDSFTALTNLKFDKLCICGGASKTVNFRIKPTELGNIDIKVKAQSYTSSDSTICGPNHSLSKVVAGDGLTKKLLVEAEGVKKEYSASIFFCPKDHINGTFSDILQLDLPDEVVPGSVFAEVEFVGDLLGPTMEGLEKLLAMPYGCGEQNMLNFAPNVYIMDYLTATQQTQPQIKTKAIKFMKSGYQRELTYKHNNGGYSAFGKRDKEASTWLTAFVLRTFAQARRYIFVDEKDIKDAREFLLSLQKPDGCFKEIGMVHQKEMTGGITSGITMTSFVLMALLEADLPPNDIRMKKAVGCINKQWDNAEDTYTLSLLSFALKKAGDATATKLLEKLDRRAIRKDELVYWTDGKKSNRKWRLICGFNFPKKSINIETTAYALMAYTDGKHYGNRMEHVNIVKWIVNQRNTRGGFSSTQDTCVGLQALSMYAASTFTKTFNINVDVKSNKSPYTTDHQVTINAGNRLLLQKYHIQETLPVNISIAASGLGCALAQANVKYNEPKPGTKQAFQINATTKQDMNSMTCRHTMKVCGSYTGGGKSNMALIDVDMVSGFEPITAELDIQQEMADTSYTQYEFIDGVLSFYFNDFSKEEKCIEFPMEQIAEVEERKPAVVKIYDYYDKDNEAMEMYKVGNCPETNIVS